MHITTFPQVKLYTFCLKLLLTASCDLFILFWSLTYNLETLFLDPALVQYPDFDLLIHYAMEEKRVFQLKSNLRFVLSSSNIPLITIPVCFEYLACNYSKM